ncbi:MAG: hypothetical protein LC721_01195 [Actinobacteria bacterium]|nr:hypothetical protein [Actinomycetota bacterium]
MPPPNFSAAKLQPPSRCVRRPADRRLQTPPAASAPVGDFRNPPAPVGQPQPPAKPGFDPSRSRAVDAETTPTKRVFANPDGSHTAELSTRPARYRDATGAWRDIDLTLTPAPDGTLKAKAAPGGSRLAASTAATDVAVLETAAGPVALRHPGAGASGAASDKATATYGGALSGRDLELTLTVDGMEEAVKLPDASAGGAYLDELVLPAGSAARNGPGGVELVGPDNKVFATFGGGFAFDAAGPGGARSAVSVRLAGQQANVATVAVAVDAGWLADRRGTSRSPSTPSSPRLRRQTAPSTR